MSLFLCLAGTGWPSFWKPIDDEHVLEITDTSIPMMVSGV